MRRSLILAVCAAAIFPAMSWGQAPAAVDQLKPYLQVKPVVGDERMVRAFFSPSCTYSRMYFQFFKNLQATLPENKTFAFTPVVNKGDGLSYALSFLAVQKFYPTYLNNFIEASLIGVQDKGLSTLNWAGIERIGRAAHVPVPVPKLVNDNVNSLRGELKALITLQHALGITNTPAVSVGGTYIVTPEFTAGDAALFSQLVNGVISMAK